MDVFDLYAKLSLDSSEYNQGLDDAKGKASDIGNAILNGLGGVAAGVGAAVGAAAAGIGALVEQSVKSFADYEQLAGGIETLFKDSSDTVLENAQNAYKTAGISANEYMDTVTSISGAIIKSTGRGAQQDLEALQESLDQQYKEEKRHWEDRIALVTDSAQKTSLKRQMEDELEALKKHNKEALAEAEKANQASTTTSESLAKAASLSDMAIQDMADQANKYGKTVEEVSVTYTSLSRGIYSTLDNLFGGMFAGTKAGLEEMLRYAEDYRAGLGETVSYSEDSYADIVSAIHDVNEALGIAGTTTEEAEHTISGSLNMLKASWGDVMTSLAGGGKSLSESIDALVYSAEAFLGNVTPVIEEALYGIGDLIMQLVPIIADILPGLAEELIPKLIDTATYLVNAIVESLPELISVLAQALLENLPALIEAIVNTIDVLLVDVLPILADLAIQIVVALATSLGENADKIITGVIVLITTIVTLVAKNLDKILVAGLTIITGIVKGLVDNLDLIIDAVVVLIFTLIDTIIQNLPQILVAAVAIGLKIVEGIVMAIPNLIISVGKMLGIVQNTKDQIDDHSTKMQGSVNASTTGISSDLDSMINDLNSKTGNMKSTLKSTSSYAASAKDDMNKKAEDLQKTSTEVQRATIYTYETIQGVVSQSRASLQSSYEDMEEDIQGLIVKFEELANVDCMPKVDPSNVVEGCDAIVEACDRAIAALKKLSGASSGGGGGFGGGHASGGWMEAGTTYLVGELGPELVTPSRSGYVHTASETASMLGRNQTINININGDVYDDQYSMRRKLKNAMLDVLQEQMAYG